LTCWSGSTEFTCAATACNRESGAIPAFDRTSGKGTLTAGNSSPLTDGAAALWVASEAGLARLPAATPRARLVDYEVASVDFREDVVGSEQLMQRVAETYRTIRNNLFRYVLSNLYDFDAQTDAVPFAKLEDIDQYMLRLTTALVADVRKWYDEFAFHRIYHRVNYFCVTELSAFYFDVLKDRLYTFAPRSPGRRSAQTAVETIARALASLLAPICVFTTEEVWKYMPRRPGDPTSVHMTLFPSPESLATDLAPDRISKWQELLGVRENVLKALEAKRNAKEINGSLEARVLLRAGGALGDLLREYERELPALFIVSQVEVAPPVASGDHGSAPGPAAGLQVDVERARGQKCERCWNYSERVGENAEFPTVCERCVAALDEITKIPTP